MLTDPGTVEALEEKLTLRFTVGVIHLGSEMIAEQRAASEERLKFTPFTFN